MSERTGQCFKLILGTAIAASALTAATPAAAQYFPQPQYGYGNQYGYQNDNGQVRVLYARVDQVSRQIRQLEYSRRLSPGQADRLNYQAQDLRQRLRQLSYGGLNPNERYDVERRLGQLEQRIRYSANNGRGYGSGQQYGYGQQYGQYGQQYGDRDGRWQNDREHREHDQRDHREHDDRDND